MNTDELTSMRKTLCDVVEQINVLIFRINSIIGSTENPQLKDQCSDQIRSDQIRLDNEPDLLSKEDRMRIFEDFCHANGVNVQDYDIRGIERNVNWVVLNLDKIKAPRSYLEKVLKNCPLKSIGFKPKGNTEPVNTDIFGVPCELVEANLDKLTLEIYEKVREQIPAYKTFVPNYRTVLDSELRKRTVVAFAIKGGEL